MASEYTPRPIDTSCVSLPDEVNGLIEKLAEDVHETWAAQRMADGWSHGSKRCDHSKTNPCLVPYGDLPETEKDYDRRVVQQTIKVIVALGYSIRREPGLRGNAHGDDPAHDRAIDDDVIA